MYCYHTIHLSPSVMKMQSPKNYGIRIESRGAAFSITIAMKILISNRCIGQDIFLFISGLYSRWTIRCIQTSGQVAERNVGLTIKQVFQTANLDFPSSNFSVVVALLGEYLHDARRFFPQKGLVDSVLPHNYFATQSQIKLDRISNC